MDTNIFEMFYKTRGWKRKPNVGDWIVPSSDPRTPVRRQIEVITSGKVVYRKWYYDGTSGLHEENHHDFARTFRLSNNGLQKIKHKYMSRL